MKKYKGFKGSGMNIKPLAQYKMNKYIREAIALYPKKLLDEAKREKSESYSKVGKSEGKDEQ